MTCIGVEVLGRKLLQREAFVSFFSLTTLNRYVVFGKATHVVHYLQANEEEEEEEEGEKKDKEVEEEKVGGFMDDLQNPSSS